MSCHLGCVRQSVASPGLLDLRINGWTSASLCAARLSIMVGASRRFTLFGMPLICLTCLALSGGHWAVFQTIAWAQMIRDYSRTATIAEAIAKTFNGRSPCGLCKKISEEREKENGMPAIVKFEKRGEIFWLAMRPYSQRPDGKDCSYFDLSGVTPAKRSQAPPAPVPKLS